MSDELEVPYVPISAEQRGKERAQAIWMLFEETCMLRRALAQYEPNVRRGLPSPLVVREVALARQIMQDSA